MRLARVGFHSLDALEIPRQQGRRGAHARTRQQRALPRPPSPARPLAVTRSSVSLLRTPCWTRGLAQLLGAIQFASWFGCTRSTDKNKSDDGDCRLVVAASSLKLLVMLVMLVMLGPQGWSPSVRKPYSRFPLPDPLLDPVEPSSIEPFTLVHVVIISWRCD